MVHPDNECGAVNTRVADAKLNRSLVVAIHMPLVALRNNDDDDDRGELQLLESERQTNT